MYLFDWFLVQPGDVLDHKQRTTIAHPLDLYSYQNYATYILYSPLYIAGPIMTFNDFLWQVRVIIVY